MSIILENKRLRAEIAYPGEEPNTTVRFDRAGFVKQVTLDGKHIFCSREPDNLPHPSSGGYGLCNEYRLPQPALDAQMGQEFPKPGIGLMTKDVEGKFVFHHPYPTRPYPIQVECRQDSILFITEPLPCMGVAIRQKKRITLENNRLMMDIETENCADEGLSFDEYCHNFITIDRLPIGEDYFLKLPVENLEGAAIKSGIALKGMQGGVGFACYSNEPTLMDLSGELFEGGLPFTWTLTHQKSAASISESVSREPMKMTIWTIDHIISPEVILHFDIAPGEKASWRRTWMFCDEEDVT